MWPQAQRDPPMEANLIEYYEAIERASDEMVDAARQGNWSEVVRIEGACALLIGRLQDAAQDTRLTPEQVKHKSRIMQRILHNDAEIRHLVEPWLAEVDDMLGAGAPQRTLH